jgi:SAM-dependent methyltransferase
MKICPDCKTGLELQACQGCGWLAEFREGFPVWLSSTDKMSDFFKKYLDNYDQIGGDDLETSIQPIDYLKIQTEYLESYLGDLTGLNVCELGIGQGTLMKRILSQNIKHYTGVDICASYLKNLSGHPNSTLIIANAENVPYEDEFDLLVASDILEHVFNVGDFLYSVNRALVSGGKFVVKVPLLEDINAYSLQRGCKYDFVHLRNFSKESLEVLLKGAGFEIERYHYDGFFISRIRTLFKNKFTNEHIIPKLWAKFPQDYLPKRINQRLGRYFMRPVEITAVCKKINNL